jgi:hypothetical protein
MRLNPRLLRFVDLEITLTKAYLRTDVVVVKSGGSNETKGDCRKEVPRVAVLTLTTHG